MNNRKRIYVAGPYSCDNHCKPLGVDLEAMRFGIRCCVDLILAGYAPFCPWLDFMFAFVPDGEKMERKDYLEYSLSWIEACEAMIVIELRKSSFGTKAEIEYAQELGIPIYYGLNNFYKGFKK